MTSMLENMLRNPQMQTMLYPYLPEPMRNPQSIEWMLSNPEVKKQMEQMFAQSGMSMSPEMMGMMKNMDFSQDKVRACGWAKALHCLAAWLWAAAVLAWWFQKAMLWLAAGVVHLLPDMSLAMTMLSAPHCS